MIKFKEFNSLKNQQNLTEEMEDKIAILMYLAESEEMLNESAINELSLLTEAEAVKKANGWLSKIGMKLHKGKGIIDYVKQFTGVAGKMILAAIKGDKEAVKKHAEGVEKHEIMDFLLKLDMATMHIVTGPIHFIDAITGWDLMVNIKHAAEGATDKLKAFYDGIKKVKDSITQVLGGDRQKRMLKVADNLEFNMPDVKAEGK
jgi:hypothetical protein